MINLLVADDDVSFLKSLVAGFEAQGEFHLTTAVNGKEAIALLAKQSVDLVLTDLKMPEMDGVDLISYMGRHHKNIPIVIMTAYGTKQMEEKFQLLGINHFLEKPLDFKSLLAIINEVIASRSITQEVQTSSNDNLKQLSEILVKAIDDGFNGEVVIKSGIKTGKIYIFNRQVAWVTASTIKPTLMGMITAFTDVPKDDLVTVFDECKQTGKNFGETLIEWGLVSRELMHKVLLEHIANSFLEILGWASIEAMFLPQSISYASSLTFTIEELLEKVLPEAPSSPAEAPLTEDPELTSTPAVERVNLLSIELRSLASIDGFLAAAVLNPKGEVITEHDPDDLHHFSATDELTQFMTRSRDLCVALDAGWATDFSITTESATVFIHSVNQNLDKSQTVPGRLHLQFVLVLDSDGNKTLAQMQFERTITGILGKFTD